MKCANAGKVFCALFLVVSLAGASGPRIARQQKAEKKQLRKDLITLRRCGYFRIAQGALSPELIEKCADTYQRLGIKLFPDHDSEGNGEDSNAFSSSSSSLSSMISTPRPSSSSSSLSSAIATPRPSSSSSSLSSVIMTPKPSSSSSSASSIPYFTPTPVRTATPIPTIPVPLATNTPIRTATPFPVITMAPTRTATPFASYPTMPTYAPSPFPVATYQTTMPPASPSITPPTSDGTIDEPIV